MTDQIILTLLTAGVTSPVGVLKGSPRIVLDPLLHFQPLLFKAFAGNRKARFHLLRKQ